MEFWTIVATIIIVSIVVQGVVQIVKHGTRYSENIERMKRGYPLKDGTEPLEKTEATRASGHNDELHQVLNRQQ